MLAIREKRVKIRGHVSVPSLFSSSLFRPGSFGFTVGTGTKQSNDTRHRTIIKINSKE
jgi:hypothetical protein